MLDILIFTHLQARLTTIKIISSNPLPLQNTQPYKFRSKFETERNCTSLGSIGSVVRLILLNWDISTSLCTSGDVKPVPQFTDVSQIGDNTGALRERQNKGKRVIPWEAYTTDVFSESDKSRDFSCC